jgi:hypothetical protein
MHFRDKSTFSIHNHPTEMDSTQNNHQGGTATTKEGSVGLTNILCQGKLKKSIFSDKSG